jgi:hypothetical protein
VLRINTESSKFRIELRAKQVSKDDVSFPRSSGDKFRRQIDAHCYNGGMSDQRNRPAKVSILRIAFATTGAIIVLLSALWIATPFVASADPTMTKWQMTPAEWFLSPRPYLGLPYVVVGLILIYCSRDVG